MENTPMQDCKQFNLTIDDQKWIKLCLDRQDEFIKDMLTGLQTTVNNIELRLDAIEIRLDSIESSLEEKEGRLQIIEKHIKPYETFLRVGFYVLCGVVVSILTFIYIHPYLK